MMRFVENFGGRRSVVAACSVVMLVAVGCGTGEYDNRLKVTLANVARRSTIEAYLTPGGTAVAGGNVSLRLPKLFDGSSKDVPVGDPRARVAGVPLPGLVKVTERAIDDPAGKMSVCYAYFAAVPKEGKPQDALQNELRGAIAAVLPNASWATENIEKMDGGSVSYPVLKASGPQSFDASGSGGANEQLEGQLELYLVPADKHWVLLGWRAPTANASKYQFFNSVKAAMGTVVVAAGAAPAAPPAGDAAPAPAPAAGEPMPAAAANNGAGEGLPPGAVGAAAGIAPLNP